MELGQFKKYLACNLARIQPTQQLTIKDIQCRIHKQNEKNYAYIDLTRTCEAFQFLEKIKDALKQINIMKANNASLVDDDDVTRLFLNITRNTTFFDEKRNELAEDVKIEFDGKATILIEVKNIVKGEDDSCKIKVNLKQAVICMKKCII